MRAAVETEPPPTEANYRVTPIRFLDVMAAPVTEPRVLTKPIKGQFISNRLVRLNSSPWLEVTSQYRENVLSSHRHAAERTRWWRRLARIFLLLDPLD